MTTLPAAVAIDLHDARRARHAPGLLRAFNDIGVLSAADVHVAVRMSSLAGEADDGVTLAAAFAVRGPRLGHVLVDLATIRSTAAVDSDEPVDLSALPWPEPDEWIRRLAESKLVAVGEDTDSDAARPLRLVGTTLYLDRYWREEREVAADLLTFSDGTPAIVDEAVLADGLARLFAGEPDDSRQRIAAATAVLRRFAVVAGGPGTGKTTTVARIVALLAEQAVAAGDPPPLIALAAPTGKAAARLEEAVHAEAAALDVDDAVRAQLLDLHASTLHRLLGWRPGSHSRFRHHRTNRLPHDVVIVDETSMVSLSLMARLVESVRPDARLVLVGDPGQLTSIEAGAVLGDIVGPATGNGIVVLDRVHRYGGGIALLAEAIRSGDPDEVMEVLAGEPADVLWIPVDAADAEARARARARSARRPSPLGVRSSRPREPAPPTMQSPPSAPSAFSARTAAERRGSPPGRLASRAGSRPRSPASTPTAPPTSAVRCSSPRTTTSCASTTATPASSSSTIATASAPPSNAAANSLEFTPDPARSDRNRVRHDDPQEPGLAVRHSGRSSAALTSRILTRELLYTAATRARTRLVLVGTAETIRTAVSRPVARASGLRSRLWAPGAGSAPGPP